MQPHLVEAGARNRMGSGTRGASPSEPLSLSGIWGVSLFALSDSLTHSSCIPTAATVQLTSFTPPPNSLVLTLLSEPGAHRSSFPREACRGWSSSLAVRLQDLVCCPSVVWLHLGWVLMESSWTVEGGGWSYHTEPGSVAWGEKHGFPGDGDCQG